MIHLYIIFRKKLVSIIIYDSWKTYRVINNINYINKINKVIFLQHDDTRCEYNDELQLSFPKYKQDGNIDMNDGIIKVSINTRIVIEINSEIQLTNGEFTSAMDSVNTIESSSF